MKQQLVKYFRSKDYYQYGIADEIEFHIHNFKSNTPKSPEKLNKAYCIGYVLYLNNGVYDEELIKEVEAWWYRCKPYYSDVVNFKKYFLKKLLPCEELIQRFDTIRCERTHITALVREFLPHLECILDYIFTEKNVSPIPVNYIFMSDFKPGIGDITDTYEAKLTKCILECYKDIIKHLEDEYILTLLTLPSKVLRLYYEDFTDWSGEDFTERWCEFRGYMYDAEVREEIFCNYYSVCKAFFYHNKIKVAPRLASLTKRFLPQITDNFYMADLLIYMASRPYYIANDDFIYRIRGIFMEDISIGSIEQNLLYYNMYLYYDVLDSLSNEKLKEVLTLPRYVLSIYKDDFLQSIGVSPTDDWVRGGRDECVPELVEYIKKCKEFLLKRSFEN